MQINSNVMVIGTGKRGRVEAIEKGIYIVRILGGGLEPYKRRELRLLTWQETTVYSFRAVLIWFATALPSQVMTVVIRAAIISLIIVLLPGDPGSMA